ncbi:MAG: thermonuclease family protein [Thermosphaera sp.]
MSIKPIPILTLLILLTTLTPLAASPDPVGVHGDFPHARVVVTEVVDGDTFCISPPVYVGGEYRTVVRLADIDAPELDTSEGQQAKQALTNLLAQHGGVVYLDIDKAGGVDGEGRVIAVAYVRENTTHLLNVNKWMIDNNHAVVEDYPNDFDPSQWNLYIEYPIQNEKLPTITRIPLHSGAIANSTSWGVRVAVTPDGNYIGVAFSDYGGDYTLHVRILDREGNIVNSYDYGPDKGSDWYANVWRGMLDIAANETGFMVAWTNLTRSGNSRVVLYSFVPVTGTPTQPQHIYLDTYQNHPLVAFFEHSNGTRWWIIGTASRPPLYPGIH